MTEVLVLTLAAYVVGSVNFAILILKARGAEDPREEGSGNPGTTNVYRQAGIFWAALVLVLDMGRSAGLAVVGLYLLTPETVPWLGLALIIGNRYPCFHGFRGGKGVANYLGFTVALSPLGAGVAALSWVGLFALVRSSFISSFLMVAVLAASNMIRSGWDPGGVTATLLTAALVYWAHRSNITQLQGARAQRTGTRVR